MARRFRQLDYFFPVHATGDRHEDRRARSSPNKSVRCADLREARYAGHQAVDPAGARRSDPESSHRRHRDGVDAALRPLMRGAVQVLAEHASTSGKLGLELLLVHPIYSPSHIGGEAPRPAFINECECRLCRFRQGRRPPRWRWKCASRCSPFYLCNQLFEEALLLLTEDPSVRLPARSRRLGRDAARPDPDDGLIQSGAGLPARVAEDERDVRALRRAQLRVVLSDRRADAVRHRARIRWRRA